MQVENRKFCELIKVEGNENMKHFTFKTSHRFTELLPGDYIMLKPDNSQEKVQKCMEYFAIKDPQ
jgi:sulfite reductase alpha subunit-like flavoprotein